MCSFVITKTFNISKDLQFSRLLIHEFSIVDYFTFFVQLRGYPKSLYNKLFDLKENILSAADQDALANIVAQRTGKSKEESKELVANWAQAADNVKQQIKETAHEASEKAKKIGDDASDAVGKAAILVFFALLLGALASIGGSVLANNKRQSSYRNSVS